MAGKSSILECLISFHRDWRVNWDYPKGSHLLMILHPVCPDAGKTWITDIHQGEVTRKSSPYDGSSQDLHLRSTSENANWEGRVFRTWKKTSIKVEKTTGLGPKSVPKGVKPDHKVPKRAWGRCWDPEDPGNGWNSKEIDRNPGKVGKSTADWVRRTPRAASAVLGRQKKWAENFSLKSL